MLDMILSGLTHRNVYAHVSYAIQLFTLVSLPLLFISIIYYLFKDPDTSISITFLTAMIFSILIPVYRYYDRLEAGKYVRENRLEVKVTRYDTDNYYHDEHHYSYYVIVNVPSLGWSREMTEVTVEELKELGFIY